MKKTLLSLLLLVVATTMNGQTLLNGDLNHDGVIDLADVTALVNVALHKAEAEAIDVYAVDNTAVVGTWYKQDGTSVTFRENGTTTYPGGDTYKYLYLLRWLQVYNSSGTLVKTMKLSEVTAQYLLEENDNGTTTRYTNAAYMVSGITLNKTSLSLNSGATGQLTATVSPSTALEKGVTWSSSNTVVATVNQSGLVTAVAGGTCTITCTAQDGSGVTATCLVTVVGGGSDSHAYVDLGLPSGTLWAISNVGASSSAAYGDYFAWGETQPKEVYDWSTYIYSNGAVDQLTKYCNNSDFGYNGFTDNLTVLQPKDDAATANWGSGWCMPTRAQWRELSQNTTKQWTPQNGVNGWLFTATNGKSLFLPAADIGGNDYTYNTDGIYWSSSLDTDNPIYASTFAFSTVNYGIFNALRYDGYSVRPVRSAPKN